MTTYREINNSEVSVDEPLTQQLFHALKDNPKAIVEDDSTAPFIDIASLYTHDCTAGDNIIMEMTGLASDYTRSGGGGVDDTIDDTSLITFEIRVKGSYKFKLITRNGYRNLRGDDTAREDTAVTTTLRHQRGDEVIDEPITYSTGERETDTATANLSCEADDLLFVKVLQTDGPAEITVTMQCGIAEADAVFGANARGVIT